jgi:hypothetical protein
MAEVQSRGAAYLKEVRERERERERERVPGSQFLL